MLTKLSLCLVLFLDCFCIGYIIPSLASLILNTDTSFLDNTISAALRHFYYHLAISLPTIFICLGAVVMGALSDFIGRKPSLLIALSGIAISCVLSAIGVNTHNVFLFLIGRAIMGIMDGSEAVAQAYMADLSTKQNKALNISYISLATSLGFIAGPLFATSLNLSHYSLFKLQSAPFYISAGIIFFGFIFILFFFKSTPRKANILPNNIITNVYRFCISVLQSKKYRPIILIFFCIQVAWGIFFQSASAYFVSEFNPTATQVSYFFLIMAISFGLTFTVIIRLALIYLNQYQLIYLGLTLVCLSALIMLLAANSKSVYFACAAVTMGVGISYNTLLTIISNNTNEQYQGQIIGLTLSLISMAWVIALILCSVLSPLYTSVCFMLMIAFCLCGFFQLTYYRPVCHELLN